MLRVNPALRREEFMLIPVADAHCDFLYNMWQDGFEIDGHGEKQTITIPYLRKGGVVLQFFAVWVDHALRTPYLQQCLGMIDAYYRVLETFSETFTPLTAAFTPEDGRIATVLTIEGGEAIEGSLAVLRLLKRLGVAAMTLTWNHNNELAGAALRRGGKGLTQLGREVVNEMERIGVAMDIAHLSDEGIDDVLGCSSTPIFASHSNAREVLYSPRSLQDSHIREIARRGGVIGVNFYHKQLCEGKVANVEDIVRHIAHIADVGGISCCAIGSDFDGMNQYPEDIQNSGDFPRLIDALITAGFSVDEVKKIAYQNLRDYIIRFV